MLKIILTILTLCFFSPAHAEKIAYPDPEDNLLNEEYLKLDHDDVQNLKKSEDAVDQYMIGYLYLRGDSRLDITKDSDEALQLLLKAWKGGVVDAGYGLSLVYYTNSEHKDLNKSKFYLIESANKGYIKSQSTLGRAYNGDILKSVFNVDKEKSICWYSKAALNGDQDSAVYLSFAYKNGDSVKVNPEKSFYWRKMATEAQYGHLDMLSFLVLGRYYEKGYGVEKNFKTAYFYYDLSGTAGSEGKQRVGERMSHSEILDAIKQSRAWQEEHNTFVPSYYRLEHQSDGSYR